MSVFLTVDDLAERYGISKASVFNHVRNGKLPRGIFIGKSHRWNIEELKTFEAKLAGNGNNELQH